MARFAIAGVLAPWMGVLTCCGGGSGNEASEGSRTRLQLQGLVFRDPSGQLSPRSPLGPTGCSLVQHVRLGFRSRLGAEDVHTHGVFVRDRERGHRINGRLHLQSGNRELVWSPFLPNRPLNWNGAEWEGSDGLLPDREYELVVPLEGPDTLGLGVDLDASLVEEYAYTEGPFVLRFRTTDDPDLFWTGLPPRRPKSIDIFPKDGSKDVDWHLFSSEDEPPFHVHFDAALHPSRDNVGASAFGLVMLDAEDPVPLRVNVRIESNEKNLSIVSVRPVGILPVGRRLALVIQERVRGLSEGKIDPGDSRVISEFRTRQASDEPIADRLAETFESRSRQESRSREYEAGWFPAAWDEQDSNRLEASFTFEGQGELGRWIPVAVGGGNTEIVLDTDRQVFPLLDGSTPDIERETVVEGGVFHFRSIHIPEKVTLVARGSQPLVLTATESITIGGTIEVLGSDGSREWTRDQSLSPLRGGVGGPGGGAGGDGHPSRFDGDSTILVSPRAGDDGKQAPRSPVRSGGAGGTSGVDGQVPHKCLQRRGDGRPGGGGGGSHLGVGTRGFDGESREDFTSREKLDPLGRQLFDPLPFRIAPGGGAGRVLFQDNDPDNDFFGIRGEYQILFGGSGGGGGGSRLDSFWCWNTYPGLPATVADARGGGGGGGGGVCDVLCLGRLILEPTAKFQARGGDGGKGEVKSGEGAWSGGGAGGSGGTVRLMSAEAITANTEPFLRPSFDMRGGKGAGHNDWSQGGDGGYGIVQVQVPAGQFLDPEDLNPNPPESLIPLERTPSELTSFSVGQSKWIDLGWGVFRNEEGPRLTFEGTTDEGFLIVDENGIQPDQSVDVRVDQLPVRDRLTNLLISPGRAWALPDNASVRVMFQGAHGLTSDGGEIDLDSRTPWSPSIDVADGYRFVRFRVEMDIAREDRGYQLDPMLPRIAVRFLKLRLEF